MLCQIRGIGRYIAMLVVAEVGDIGRFPSAASCAPWLDQDGNPGSRGIALMLPITDS